MTQHTIVIADDDRDLADALELRLRSLGLEVYKNYDGFTALNRIHEHCPDLICLDVNMPGGNGLSVCEMIAGDERLRRIPVIMMTGDADQETIRRCHRLCAYYVEKCPDLWSRIEPLIRELLVPER